MKDLKAFLDGELDAASASTFQTQLQSDGTLAAMAADFRRLSSSLAALDHGPAVTGRERALRAVSAPPTRSFNWGLAGAVASVILVAVVAANLLPRLGATGNLGPQQEAAVSAAPAPGAGLAQPQESEAPGRKSAGAEDNIRQAPSSASIPEGSFERQVIKTARLTVRVKSIEVAEAEVNKWVADARGYVSGTTSNNLSGNRPSMTMTVRVPQAKYLDALAAFEKLGTRTSKNTDSSDVTQEMADLNARLKNMRAEEETYRAILRSARKIGEIIDVQQRLSAIRGDIESMQAQRDAMAKLAALSTIELTLAERVAQDDSAAGWVEDTWTSATRALSDAFKSLSVMAIWILVYTPIWLPTGILALWGWRRALRA